MEQGYELMLSAIKDAAVAQAKESLLYIPLQGKHTTNLEEESFDLAEKIKHFFVFDEKNTSDPRVLLLMGEAGSGKSVFAQQLFQQLWQERKETDPIPLWIPLPELERPFEEAVEEVLRKYGFNESQISEMKAKEKFTFIVDGYDELHQFQNCYVTNKWDQWNAKVLITCRSQALYYQQDPCKYFVPFNGEKRLPMLLRRLYIAPFSKDQITAYVKKYQKLNTEHKIFEEDFTKFPGLVDLINTPFLLHLTVEALPAILAEKVDDQKMAQAKLYDVIIERWFARQIKKLSAARLLKDTEQNTNQRFWIYCKKLAIKMHEKQITLIPYQGQKVGGRLFGKQGRTNSWESFFNEGSEMLRSACPLKRFGEHSYGFSHESFVEYFATRSLCEAVSELHVFNNEVATLDLKPPIQQTQSQGYIHNRLFTEEPGIQFLADRIQMNRNFKQRMLDLIEKSKRSERYTIGAANAITALVRAGIIFNGAELAGIRISGANISGGFFDQTNFAGSDLKLVKMYRTWLRSANLQGCQLEGIRFGEYRWFSQKNDQEIQNFVYLENENKLVTVESKGICVWDIKTRECGKRLFSSTCNDETQFSSCSQDGKNIITKDGMNTLLLVNIVNNDVTRFGKDVGRPYCSVLSTDQRTIVYGGSTSLYVYSVSDGSNKELIGHENSVKCVSMSLDGNVVISGGVDQTVRIWDLMNGDSNVLRGHQDWVTTVSISRDGQKLASGDKAGSIFIWDRMSGKSNILRGHYGPVLRVSFNMNGDMLVSGGFDTTVLIWDLVNFQPKIFHGHNGAVTSVCFSKDEQTIISSSLDGTVRVWDVAAGGKNIRQRRNNNLENSADLSADEKEVIRVSLERAGKRYKAERFIGLACDESITLKLDDKTSIKTESVRVNETFHWKIILIENDITKEIGEHAKIITCLDISKNKQILVSGGLDRTVCIWSLKTESLIFKIYVSEQVDSVCVDDELGLIAICTEDRSVQLWQRLDPEWKSWRFKWSSEFVSSSRSLNLSECSVIGSKGLFFEDRQLIEQRGGVVENNLIEDENDDTIEHKKCIIN